MTSIETQKWPERKSSFQTLLKEAFGDNIPKDTRELRADLERKKTSLAYSEDFKAKIQELLLMVKRRENREARFVALQGTNEKFKNRNIDEVRASEFLALEGGSKFMASTFVYKTTPAGEQIPFDGNVSSLVEGDNLTVDFGENRSVNRSIGAGDLLPANIRVVKIVDPTGKERIGTRKNTPRPGYYDAAGYIELYSGYSIQIPRRADFSRPEFGEVASVGTVIASDEAVKAEIESEKLSRAKYFEQVLWSEERESRIRSVSLEKNKSFLENATTIAKKIEEEFGIPWKVIVGQSALETGYGRHLAGGNNYFGIKARKWEASVASATKEVLGGKEVTITDNFKSYSDMTESFLDYARLLTTNPRYSKAFAYGKDMVVLPSYYPKNLTGRPNYNPELFLSEIISAGYATDPDYVTKVARMWGKWETEWLLTA